MVKVKFTKRLLYEGFQYAAGDIATIREGEALHHYGMGDAEPHFSNLVQKNFGLPKVNNFKNTHGKQI